MTSFGSGYVLPEPERTSSKSVNAQNWVREKGKELPVDSQGRNDSESYASPFRRTGVKILEVSPPPRRRSAFGENQTGNSTSLPTSHLITSSPSYPPSSLRNS